MMGVQPINEGIFKKSGKLKDLITSLFKKKSADEVLTQVNPYEEKYGSLVNGISYVDGLYVDNQSQTTKKDVVNYNGDFLSISVITRDKLPLPNDPNKTSTNFSCSVQFQMSKKTTDNTQSGFEYYSYFKSIYYIDGKETDKLSQMRINENFTCVSGTLQNKPGDCVFPQDLREKIMKTFEKSRYINDVKTWLDKIK
jgi:hypothetical protein